MARPENAADGDSTKPSCGEQETSSDVGEHDDEHERAEYERELRHFERTSHIQPSKHVK